MFKGQSTCEAYEQCLTIGLCKNHLEELSEDMNVIDPHELQRKALLYIRLRILDPLLFGKPFVFDRMKMLVSRSGFFKGDRITDAELVGQNSWHQSILLLDSVVVFTLCEFCKVCCCGGLFLSSQETKSSHPEAVFIHKLLSSKNVTESDISHFNPLLQNNFKGYDTGLIKFCYVVALLFVRNITVKLRLNQALAGLSLELQSISKETEKWIKIGGDALKKQKFEDAIEAYTSALKYNPYCVAGLSQRALVYLEVQKFKQAQLDSYVALMIDPQHNLSYILLASSLNKQHCRSECDKVVQYGLQKCNQANTEKYKKLVEFSNQVKKGGVKEQKSSNKETDTSVAGNILKKESSKNMDPPDLEDPDSENEDPPDLEDPDSETEGENGATSKKVKETTTQSPFLLGNNRPAIGITKKIRSSFTIKQRKLAGLNTRCERPRKYSSNLTAGNVEIGKPTVEDTSLNPELSEIKQQKLAGLCNTRCEKDELPWKRPGKYSSNLTTGNVERGKPTVEDTSLNPELSEEEKKSKHKELFLELKEGSQTLLDGCGQSAVRHFDAALGIVKDFPKVCQFDDWELVCIKYAYGFAYCTSGGYEDLQKSIAVFKEIIEDFSSVSFPAVYYGIGLSFYKLNRFKDALTYLKTVEDILAKGIRFKVYAWPGLNSAINETKFDQLKLLVRSLIKDCEAPPPPDAICRLNDCMYQPSIYFTDPDFKGFYCLQCSDHCFLQYHPHCWKVLKNYKQFSDKEFLGQNCLTPDCDGTVITVESINKEGIMEKKFGTTEVKKSAKQKKIKLPKKIDIKEEKKKKRQNCRDIETDKNRGLLDRSSVSPSELSESPTHDSAIKDNSVKSETENLTNNLIKEPNKSSTDCTPLSVHAEPYIMIKKEKINSETSYEYVPNRNELKKANENTFNVYSKKKEIDEHRKPIPQRNQCIIEDNWPTYNDMNVDPVMTSYVDNTEPTASDSNQFEQDLFGEISDSEAIKSNLYNYMENFLNRNGPLSIKDSRLIDELETFPTIANIVIAKCGGIADFLKEDTEYRFGIVDNLFICSRNDLADAYKLSRSSGIIGSDNLDLLEELGTETTEILTSNGIETSLNPEAKEYTPSSNSSSSFNSITSFTEEFSAESKNEVSQRGSSSLITAISKLREPIAVDNDGNKNGAPGTDALDILQRKNSSTSLIPHSLVESFQSKEIIGNEEVCNKTIQQRKNSSANLIPDPLGDDLECKEIIGNKEMNLSEKCIEGVNLYFREDMMPQRAYIDSCIRPYGIVHISDKTDQNLQTEDVQFDVESKTGKLEEVLKLKEVIETLTDEKRELLVQKTLAETKLESELDSATKHKKQAAIEIANLKRELEDATLRLESQKNELKNKQFSTEKEHSILVENLKKTTEENVQLKKEVSDIRSRMESLVESLHKFEETMHCVESENKLLKKTLDQQNLKNSESAQNFEIEKLKFTQRVKEAELRFLQLKKESVFQKIDSKTYEAAQNMKSVENFLQSPLSSSVPLFKTSLEGLMNQIRGCISKLAEIRLEFQSRIDEQINAVNNGTSSGALPPIEVKNLPEIPSLQNILKPSKPGNTQNASYNAQMMNLWNSACNFPSSSSTGAMNGAFCSNPSMFMPSQTTSMPSYQKVPNDTAKQNVQAPNSEPKKTKLPPGIKNLNVPTSETKDSQVKVEKSKISDTTPILNSTSSANTSAIPNVPPVECSSRTSQAEDIQKEVSGTSQSSEKPIAKTISQTSLASSSSTIDVDLPSNCDNPSLELGYNVQKNDTSKSNSNSLPVGPVKPKGTYAKLLKKLKSKHPSYEADDLMQYVKQLREKRKGGLSGLTIDNIISSVSELIESSKPSPQIEKPVAQNANISKQGKTLKNKKMTLDLKEETPQKPKPCPWAPTSNDSKSNWSGNNVLGEECIICYSEMTITTAYKVDCGHYFHLNCIRKWLNKKSDCPICRVHLLLPEDYPALS